MTDLSLSDTPLPAEPPVEDETAPARVAPWRLVHAWFLRHQTVLWWMHSAWALAFGIGVMWLGARDVRWLRLTYGYIAFIWLSSMALPWVARLEWLPRPAHAWLQLAVNYFNKNFYQQLLFFVLPLYWASTTLPSRNAWFMVLVALSAVLSTFDVVYDRHLSVRRTLTATFFAFNLFATVNVILPVLWGVDTVLAMRSSVALAAVGFMTIRSGLAGLSPLRQWRVALVGGLVLLLMTEYGRPLIPPAPLALGPTVFGRAIATGSLRIASPLDAWTASDGGRLAVVSAIRAPVGLHDRVRLVWSVEGKEFQRSRGIDVVGGRAAGYRVWSVVAVPATRAGQRIVLNLETEGGQLIGRTSLPVR